ncbi:MAG: hypothetical protein CMH56_03495 [Myxococcales bacterium]|nr:hypothetical protein [Myxococcales bacterium]
MKRTLLKTKTLSLALVAGALIFAGTYAADGEAKAEGPKASIVKGQVEVGTSKDGPWKRLKRNRRVQPGNFVKTGSGAKAELKYGDGSVIRVASNSILHLEQAGFAAKSSEVQVKSNLVAGKAWAKVSKMVGSEARFEVKTENAVAGVRGTVFRVNVEEDAATVVKVYEGAVAVSNSPFFNAAKKKTMKKAPVDFKGRKEIDPTTLFQEVSKKKWEQLVGQMMQVRVRADGSMDKAESFTAEADVAGDKDWVAWNQGCDQGKCE